MNNLHQSYIEPTPEKSLNPIKDARLPFVKGRITGYEKVATVYSTAATFLSFSSFARNVLLLFVTCML